MNELSTLIVHDSDYRRSSLLCFAETWLSEQTTDVRFDGYTTIRFDRNKIMTDKSIGGAFARACVRACVRVCVCVSVCVLCVLIIQQVNIYKNMNISLVITNYTL